MVSAVMGGTASHKFFPQKKTKPKRGWPNLTCFETISDARAFYRQYCAYKALLKFEIWLVKITNGKSHGYANINAIERNGKLGLGCKTTCITWPHGTIFAESITPIRRIYGKEIL